MSSGILAPAPNTDLATRRPPQTAAARNAPAGPMRLTSTFMAVSQIIEYFSSDITISVHR